GTTRLVTCWHAIGHPHEMPGVAADCRVTNVKFNGSCETFRELSIITSYVMGAFEELDPLQHDRMRALYEWRLREVASSVAMAAVDPGMFFEGREMQFNRYSLLHFDTNDPSWAWAIIIYFGTFPTCTLKFRQLMLQVTLRPGDMVMMRGRDVLHEVCDWDLGERHLLVHFTHQTLWKQANIKCESGLAVIRD
ncbi:hypothetical protein K466DRAFT_507451, partial [Polyporus arcularius HHB13444]